MDAVAIEQMIMLIAGIVAPMIGGGAYKIHKQNQEVNKREVALNEGKVQNSITEYKYGNMVSFIKQVAIALEDEKITPSEAKLLSRQLKALLDSNSFGMPIEKGAINSMNGGFISNTGGVY